MPGKKFMCVGALLIGTTSLTAVQSYGAVSKTSASSLRSMLIRLNANCLKMDKHRPAECSVYLKKGHPVGIGKEAAAICDMFVPVRPSKSDWLTFVSIEATNSSIGLGCSWSRSLLDSTFAPVSIGIKLPVRVRTFRIPPCSAYQGAECSNQGHGGMLVGWSYGTSFSPGFRYNFPVGEVGLQRNGNNASAMTGYYMPDWRLLRKLGKAIGLPLAGK